MRSEEFTLLEKHIKQYELEIQGIVAIRSDSTLTPIGKGLLEQRKKEEILRDYTEVFGRDLPRIIDRHVAMLESGAVTVEDKGTDVFALTEFLKQDFWMSWLCLNYFTLGSLYFLVARAKTGKTDLTNYLTRCIITGSPFLGMPTQKGKVLWVQLEESNGSLSRKARRHGFDRLENAEAVVVVRSLDLYNDFAKLERLVEEHKPIAVFIDTVRAAMASSGIDENKAQFADVFYKVQALAIRSSCTMICLHHQNKRSSNNSGDVLDSVSGTSKLSGIGDGTLILEREKGETLLHFVTRDVDRKTLKLRRKVSASRVVDYELEEEVGVDEALQNTQRRIIRALTNSPELSEEELRQAISEENLGYAIDRMLDSFMLDYRILDYRADGGKPLYFIPESSKELWRNTMEFQDLEATIATANQLAKLSTDEEIRAFVAAWSPDYKAKVWSLLAKCTEQFRLLTILLPPPLQGERFESESDVYTLNAASYDDGLKAYRYDALDECGDVYLTDLSEAEINQRGRIATPSHPTVLAR